MMGMLQHQMIQAVALALAGVLLLTYLPEASADDPPCGTTLTVSSGPISLPASAPKGLCVIKVKRTSTDGFTTFQFNSVNMKGGDSMIIYDGDSKTENVITQIDTGTVKGPFTVVAMTQESTISINVTTDTTTSIMEAMYNATACNIDQMVNSAMYVQSPLYKLGAKFTCSYSYSLEDKSGDTALALSFLQVSMSTATLKITSPAGIDPVTGNKIPADVYTSDTLTMELTVSDSKTAQNFSASLSAVTLSGDCGKTVNVTDAMNLTLTVPKDYPMSYDCRVTLQAKDGQSLMLSITTLQLIGTGDQLTVVDGPSLMVGNVLASLTQATTGYMVLSGTKQIVVRLVVDEMFGQRSLVAKVTELATINHLYDSGNLTITPPSGAADFPLTQYYVLEAAAGNMVVFDLGANEANKTYNYIINVYDGCQLSSPLLVAFSSEESGRVQVTSTGSKLLVAATWNNKSEGLESSFLSTNGPGYDQMMSASSGSFRLTTSTTSPAPAKCTWTITNKSGTTMLTFPVMKLTKKASVTVSSGSQVAVLTADNTNSGNPLPSIAVPVSSSWPQIVFSAGSDNLTTVEVEVLFHVVGSLCGEQINDKHGHLQSPLFPNLYPLNSDCKWTFPGNVSGRLLFFNFSPFQLAKNHSLTFVEHVNSSVKNVVGTYGGMMSLPSLLYASDLASDVTFSAAPSPSALQSIEVKQGFDVEYWVLTCGGNMTDSSVNISSPGYPTPVTGSSPKLCVWTITMPPTNTSMSGSVNIVKMNFVLKTTGTVNLNETVKVYDGNTLAAPPLYYDAKTGNTSYSLHNTVIIVFNASTLATAKDSVAFQVKYMTYTCNSSNLCDNGLCIHPGWLCDMKDDCGDNTDERNCVYNPNPTPAPQPASQTGAKPYVVALLFFIGLFLGILATVCLPRIVRRFRSNRYTAFQNEPALA